MSPRTDSPRWVDDYHHLRTAGYVADVSRTYVRMLGRDRATFLHGMCTNNTKDLVAGAGCEAFVTNVQGKVVGHILVFAHDDHLEILGSSDQASSLISHWERYIIREDVRLEDVSASRATWLLGGDQLAARLASAGIALPGPPRLRHAAAQLGKTAIHLYRFEVTPPLWLLTADRTRQEDIDRALREANCLACSLEAWDALRLEIGWPLYGRDVVLDNFPQEVGRDRQAISFTKGCYLGQETVARIDALGHVNRVLRGLRLPPSMTCEAGESLYHEGKIAAHLTSITYSPRLEAPLAMAYVRRAWEQPGSRLPLEKGGSIEVLALPLDAQSIGEQGGP